MQSALPSLFHIDQWMRCMANVWEKITDLNEMRLTFILIVNRMNKNLFFSQKNFISFCQLKIHFSMKNKKCALKPVKMLLRSLIHKWLLKLVYFFFSCVLFRVKKHYFIRPKKKKRRRKHLKFIRYFTGDSLNLSWFRKQSNRINKPHAKKSWLSSSKILWQSLLCMYNIYYHSEQWRECIVSDAIIDQCWAHLVFVALFHDSVR